MCQTNRAVSLVLAGRSSNPNLDNTLVTICIGSSSLLISLCFYALYGRFGALAVLRAIIGKPVSLVFISTLVSYPHRILSCIWSISSYFPGFKSCLWVLTGSSVTLPWTGRIKTNIEPTRLSGKHLVKLFPHSSTLSTASGEICNNSVRLVRGFRGYCGSLSWKWRPRQRS